MIRSHAREFREAIFPFCNPPRVVSVRNGTYFWRNLTLPRCHLPRHDDSSLHRTEKKKRRKEGKEKTRPCSRFVQSRMVEPCTGREEIGSASEQFITREGKWSRNLRFFCRPRGITRNHFFSNDFFVRPISRNDLSIYKRSARNKIALLLCLKIVWVISRERERRKNAITVPVY